MSTIFVLSTVSFATEPDIPANTTTVSCTDSALNSNGGPTNIEVNWEPNEINLHWYADENATVELSVPATAQSCTYDETLTPPATIPTRTGYTFKGWRVRGLPDGYTKLQYIESTGTQYINTGVVQDTKNFQVEFMISYADATNRYIFGVSSESPMYFGRANSNNGATFEQNQRYTSLSSGVNIPVKLRWGKNDDNNKMKLVVTKGNQTETLISNRDVALTNKTFILVANNSSTINRILNGRIYYAKIYKNGILAFYGIPAKDSNDVVGMYDTVTKTFFTNSGSGVFDAGPVAQ